MEENLSLLNKTALFSGIEPKEILSMLSCLLSYTTHYDKGQTILQYGDNVTHVGMVLTGTVLITKDDFWGNRTIIAESTTGSLFAETYACISSQPLEVNVIAASACDVLFLDFRKILTVCSCSCEFHTQLIHNLLSVLAKKNIMLTKKMEHMSQKTTQEKLLSYLSNESFLARSSTFEIPFNRQQLADYLSVDRSAMSHELGKLKTEGILDYSKNKFTLKEFHSNNF